MLRPREVFTPLTSVCFQRKTEFSVSKSLYLARSEYSRPPKPENHNRVDVWSLKPPDFSLKLYTTVSPLRKKEINFSPKVTGSGNVRTSTMILPCIYLSAKSKKKKKEPPEFITRYRPPDALETQVRFIRMGKFPTEPYDNPRSHDFRGLDDNLPDMVTTYDRDPRSLNLRIKYLDTLRTVRSDMDYCPKDTRTKMDTFKPAEPKWEPDIYLPRSPWPPKSASYTRHCRRRGAYSAFLDRVEEKLSKTWKNNLCVQ